VVYTPMTDGDYRCKPRILGALCLLHHRALPALCEACTVAGPGYTWLDYWLQCIPLEGEAQVGICCCV
jgi:hypothetical protein